MMPALLARCHAVPVVLGVPPRRSRTLSECFFFPSRVLLRAIAIETAVDFAEMGAKFANPPSTQISIGAGTAEVPGLFRLYLEKRSAGVQRWGNIGYRTERTEKSLSVLSTQPVNPPC